eukprot:gene21560-21186_t
MSKCFVIFLAVLSILQTAVACNCGCYKGVNGASDAKYYSVTKGCQVIWCCPVTTATTSTATTTTQTTDPDATVTSTTTTTWLDTGQYTIASEATQ